MRLRKNRELKILEQVAANNGVSVDDVKREIGLAIAISMSNSDIVETGALKLDTKNKPITPEHMIRLLTTQVKHEMKNKTFA